MSRLARALTLAVMMAAMQLAAMTAVAQAHTSNDPASTQHRALGRAEFVATVAQAHATDQPSGRADATVRRLLARERSSTPSRTPAHPRLLLEEERSSILNLPNRTPAQAAADAAHRRLLAQERYYSTWTYGNTSAPTPPEPSGQPGWLTPALGVLAAVLALVAGVAALAARRAHRTQRASQTA
jgi:hypothetical protein